MTRSDGQHRRDQVLARLLQVVTAVAADTQARSLAIYYARPSLARDMRHLLGVGSELILTGCRCRMALIWPSIEAYVESLSRKRRKTVRVEMATFRRSELSISTERLSHCCETIAPLLAELEGRHGHGGDAAASLQRLQNQAHHMDARSVVFLCHRRNEVVGFSLCFLQEDTLFVRNAGFRGGFPRRDAAYFNLIYYEPVRHAIAAGCRVIDFGLAAEEAKLLRGAEPEAVWTILVAPQQFRTEWERFLAGNYRRQLQRYIGSLDKLALGWSSEDWDPGLWPGTGPLPQ